MHSYPNLVRYLEKRVPDKLASMRKADPRNYDMLYDHVEFDASTEARTGSGNGVPPTHSTGAPPPTGPLGPKQRNTMLRLINEFAAELTSDLSKKIRATDRRLRRLQHIKTLGGALAVLSGAVLAAMPNLGASKPAIAIFSAVASCVGGLATLSASVYERNAHGAGLAADDYKTQMETRAELNAIARRVRDDHVLPLSDSEIIAYYNACGKISDNLPKYRI